jgi:hypothetical protein
MSKTDPNRAYGESAIVYAVLAAALTIIVVTVALLLL